MFALLALSCRQQRELEQVDFNEVMELKRPAAFPGSGINICVGSMITPAEGYAYYKRLLDYISQKIKRKVNFIEKVTYAEVNALLKNGSIDAAFVCGGPYVIGHDDFGLELLAAPLIDGQAVYYSYIIVARNSRIEKLEDLRGKTFAFADPLSNTGKLIPTYMLGEIGETPEKFFKEYLYTYNHDTSIKAVAQGVVDAAAVDSLIWNYMDKKNNRYTKETKIIKTSSPYGIPPVVVRPGLDKELKMGLKGILLNMHKEKEGKEILEQMFIDRFIEITDAHYDAIREIRSMVKE